MQWHSAVHVVSHDMDHAIEYTHLKGNLQEEIPRSTQQVQNLLCRFNRRRSGIEIGSIGYRQRNIRCSMCDTKLWIPALAKESIDF